jgi:hypothetical protein
MLEQFNHSHNFASKNEFFFFIQHQEMYIRPPENVHDFDSVTKLICSYLYN